tara:strand:- start:2 stop:1408 length:1407 start_codon:yes stop_codon:yes gene_type:complete
VDLRSKLLKLERRLSEAQRIILEQSQQIKKQSEEISRLQSMLSEKIVKTTSSNSHLPPSKDLASTIKRNQSLREKSTRPIGGQKGHKGHTLQMVAHPTQVEDLISAYCNKCGGSLDSGSKQLVSRRQVFDIPVIEPEIIEYRQYGIICDCGHLQKANYPEHVTNHVQYGKNLQSLVIYQSVYQYMPFKRLQDFFDKVMGVCLSKGTLENILRRSALKAESTYQKLRKVVEVSLFVGSDETGAKVKGKKSWFWVWQTALVTYMLAACSRSKKVIEDTFPDGLPNAIVCSDRLAAQLSTVSKGSQICLVHLLRDLNFLIEKEKTPWAKEFKQLLKDAIALKQEQVQYQRGDPRTKDIEDRTDRLLSDSFAELGWEKEAHHKTMTFFKAMVKLRECLFVFLYRTDVPPDNNASERAVRPIKVKMKISGQFKSLQQEFAILRSIVDTAIKNGQPVFETIKSIVEIPNVKTTG